MDYEEFEVMNAKEFEYMLRSERAFLEELLDMGPGEEAEEKIRKRLRVIDETLGTD